MNVPECDKLKDNYNNCINHFLKKPLSDFQVGLFECNEVFQDYKDCVEIFMKKKIEDRKKNSMIGNKKK